MKYLVTASEMKRYDANTIEKTGIPGMVLMERAALFALCVIKQHFKINEKTIQNPSTVLIVAGMGNNGGDGLALARLLCEEGFLVEVWNIGNPHKASGQCRLQREILKHYPVTYKDTAQKPADFGSGSKYPEYDMIIDALFGVGLSRELAGEYAEAVHYCNERQAFKLSLDVPSGICSDTGKVLGAWAFRADATVTFGFAKRGLFQYPGCLYAGKVLTGPIGITENSFYGKEPEMFYYDEPLAELLPPRSHEGNKGTFGKALLIAGSLNMAGAAVLSAKAAYRMGAGMVKVLTIPENRVILQDRVPEALVGVYDDLEEGLRWADVVGIGPGLGQGSEAHEALKKVIFGSRLPLLLDGDALNLLAKDGSLRWELAAQGQQPCRKQQAMEKPMPAGKRLPLKGQAENSGEMGREIVLTPHVGELSRLTGKSITELKEDLAAHTNLLASELHAVVAAKDARTYICREGKPVCLNIRGNSGMATAGSGDVLAGCILGLMAQGEDAFRAASIGVYAHAMAGDAAAQVHGEHGCMAGDIAEMLGKA